jgi:hypothetical protein
MGEPAYIAIADDGHVTLFLGDGTEAQKTVLWRGPLAPQGQELAYLMEDLKAWAEENGYTVVIPVYDLEVPDDLNIDISDQEAESIDLDDVNDLLDDLYSSEGE